MDPDPGDPKTYGYGSVTLLKITRRSPIYRYPTEYVIGAWPIQICLIRANYLQEKNRFLNKSDAKADPDEVMGLR